MPFPRHHQQREFHALFEGLCDGHLPFLRQEILCHARQEFCRRKEGAEREWRIPWREMDPHPPPHLAGLHRLCLLRGTYLPGTGVVARFRQHGAGAIYHRPPLHLGPLSFQDARARQCREDRPDEREHTPRTTMGDAGAGSMEMDHARRTVVHRPGGEKFRVDGCRAGERSLPLAEGYRQHRLFPYRRQREQRLCL